ncbi:MAG: HEPN domain-containing protein [Candidatus Kapaibacteriota bacterium]
MKDLFRQRSTQNLRAAEILAEAGLFDAAANRSYYAAFDAAFVACLHFGVPVVPDHAKVLSAFCSELVARQKIYPSRLKNDLYELQRLRVQADYKNSPVSKSKAQQSLKTATFILETILEKIQL